MSQAAVKQLFQQAGQDSALQEQLKSAKSLSALSSKALEIGKKVYSNPI